MPSWNELLDEVGRQKTDEAKSAWLVAKQLESLQAISTLRGGRNVLLYGSGFLQKPQAPSLTISISAEDINGLMSTIYGMDWDKGLTLILHTPGGSINAAESIVDYLRSKFQDIEVVVPTFAMSAGTMIALAADRIFMGRPSQLGPFDPQMPFGGRSVSAQAVVDQFDKAKSEILKTNALGSAWAPVLQSLGPAMLVEAKNALDYGESMVAKWLGAYMLAGTANVDAEAARIAHHFNDAGKHKSHGRRIGIQEAIDQGLKIESLEKEQALQEAVLTTYHLMTIGFENSNASKVMISDKGRTWIKNWANPQEAALAAQRPPGAAPPASPSVPPMNRQQRRAAGR